MKTCRERENRENDAVKKSRKESRGLTNDDDDDVVVVAGSRDSNTGFCITEETFQHEEGQKRHSEERAKQAAL